MSNELKKALTKIANQDLALARKNGRITVAQTRMGNVDVSYFGNDHYGLSARGEVLGDFTAEGARSYLINAYDVVQG